jgi:Cu+-exporting ATPase
VSAVTSGSPAGPVRGTELAIGGMTCASRAARIERKLNRLDGVSAAVNLATETARVTFPATVSSEELISVVEQAGYTAALAAAEQDEPSSEDGAAETTALRRRLLVSLALAIPVVLLAMVPAWQFTYWQWVSLALATPVADPGRAAHRQRDVRGPAGGEDRRRRGGRLGELGGGHLDAHRRAGAGRGRAR